MAVVSVDGVKFTGKTDVINALKRELRATVLHAQPSPVEFNLTTRKGVSGSLDYYLGENAAMARKLRSLTRDHPDAVFVLDRLYSTEAYHKAMDSVQFNGRGARFIDARVRSAQRSMPKVDVAVFLYTSMKERRNRIGGWAKEHPDVDIVEHMKDEPEQVAEMMQHNLARIAARVGRRGRKTVSVELNLPLRELPNAALANVRANASIPSEPVAVI